MAQLQNLDHKHIFINAPVKSPPTDPKATEDWMTRLVAAVDMKLLIGPHVTYCDTPGNEGITGVMCIETSHGSIHVWSEADVPFLRFDLYSCKAFDPQIVIDFIMEFDPYFYHMMLIDRNDNMKVIVKESKQVAKIIDMMSPQQKEDYLDAERVETKNRTPAHKAARSEYGRLRRLYSLKAKRS